MTCTGLLLFFKHVANKEYIIYVRKFILGKYHGLQVLNLFDVVHTINIKLKCQYILHCIAYVLKCIDGYTKF